MSDGFNGVDFARKLSLGLEGFDPWAASWSRMTQKGSGGDELFEELQPELSDRPIICDVIFSDKDFISPAFCNRWKGEWASDFRV